ncbi:MAG: hypothetical protein UY48_C0004G0017 [Candidatus Gottesmanbacteria bacterium GW2011_GWB1_49_7]|uniref:Uncharacterized protein n=1 Tax=Candidatus Gottesmanbacteria bacterium GW2011_GWB1_49_7 TaxID=1618448 RepID=A0A0G1YDX8_9BACT|nr:MAG: hypothetical protein UY48_C0004G0017 [Candidatus Gottesmanbacteria bacterium GW2011_GWB1_49_7]
MSLDPEIRLMAQVIEEAFDADREELDLRQRLKIMIEASRTAIQGKKDRAGQFTVERLGSFLYKLTMALRMHIKDPKVIKEISTSVALLLKEYELPVLISTVSNEKT